MLEDVSLDPYQRAPAPHTPPRVEKALWGGGVSHTSQWRHLILPQSLPDAHKHISPGNAHSGARPGKVRSHEVCVVIITNQAILAAFTVSSLSPRHTMTNYTSHNAPVSACSSVLHTGLDLPDPWHQGASLFPKKLIKFSPKLA